MNKKLFEKVLMLFVLCTIFSLSYYDLWQTCDIFRTPLGILWAVCRFSTTCALLSTFMFVKIGDSVLAHSILLLLYLTSVVLNFVMLLSCPTYYGELNVFLSAIFFVYSMLFLVMNLFNGTWIIGHAIYEREEISWHPSIAMRFSFKWICWVLYVVNLSYLLVKLMWNSIPFNRDIHLVNGSVVIMTAFSLGFMSKTMDRETAVDSKWKKITKRVFRFLAFYVLLLLCFSGIFVKEPEDNEESTEKMKHNSYHTYVFLFWIFILHSFIEDNFRNRVSESYWEDIEKFHSGIQEENRLEERLQTLQL
ncbi:uncharacterized protein LOC116340407 isoform X2 [Contarinia nasturtii]|uniref:uncharacterized protein LOC116340407 isoform X2 n=1 Tax=Contarinia nasturtii TaxID=265458 RepID=UPI0012D40BAE|nr:uncharacterized protein LOC116340407 isoform X2 [Contarinia nasturtii]